MTRDIALFIGGIVVAYAWCVWGDRRRARKAAGTWRQPRVVCHCGRTYRLGENGNYATCSEVCAVRMRDGLR